MTIANLAILISILSFIVSVVSLRSDRRSNLIAELDLLTNLQAEWRDLQEQWQRANLTVYGSQSYFTLGSEELRSEFDMLIRKMSYGSLSRHEAQVAAFPWTSAIQEVVDYFGSVASYVLTGQLAPTHAYAIFGPPVVRRSRVVRAMVGDRNLKFGGWQSDTTEHFEGYRPAHYSDSSQGVDNDWLDEWMNAGQFSGRTERILCLLDVLWAEAALRQDMLRIDTIIAAMVKRDRATGPRNRKRIMRVTRQLGGSWFLALRLQWHLTHSEVVIDLPEEDTFYRQRNEFEYFSDQSIRGGRISRLRLLIVGMLDNKVIRRLLPERARSSTPATISR